MSNSSPALVFVLLALAIAPGLAIVMFIYERDKLDREPFHLLILPRAGVKLAQVAGRLFGREADHVDGGIELLALHRAFKCRAVAAISSNDAHAFRWRVALTAIKDRNFVPLLQQQINHRCADVACSTDNANFHFRNLLFCASHALRLRQRAFHHLWRS